MYSKVVYDMGEYVDVEIYHPGNYGNPGQPRKKRLLPTCKSKKVANQRAKERRMKRLLLMNFKPGDWHIVLHYRDKTLPPDFKTGKANINKFLRRIKRIYKKAGHPFKYIVVTEAGSRTQALHHHIIIEDIITPELNTTQIIKELWTKEYGVVHFNAMYEDGHFKELAEYLVKQETKDKHEQNSYSRSRNLLSPEVKKELVHKKTWDRSPQAGKGYEVIKESVENIVNPISGYPYQRYTMKKTGGND